MIAVRDLTIGYGRTEVAADISLDVAPGRVHCLLGPNGCGKTTLFKTILGLIPRLGGSVHVDGDDLDALSTLERAGRISYVPQQHAPPFPFLVEDVVMMGRQARLGLFAAPGEADRKRVAAVLAQLSIGHLAGRDYSRISGGQRQMVLIARALVQDTRLMVLDEPTASLDYGNQVRVIREIRRLAATGYAVVLSTHNPDHAFAAADTVTLMHDGRLMATGDPQSVLTPERLGRVYGVEIAVETLSDGARVCAPRY